MLCCLFFCSALKKSIALHHKNAERLRTFVSLKRLDSLSKFGPLTKDETLQKELKEARSKILELDTCFAKVCAENDPLKSKVFRYDNVKGDPQQLLFLTGLTIGNKG